MTGPKKGNSAPRIGSGALRGMILGTPEGQLTRPTAAKVRAAVMNTLQGQFAQARVLDLFAGSGAVGLEAISRGAADCHFLERDRRAIVRLKENCAEAERRIQVQDLEPKRLTIELGEVMGFLRKSAAASGKLDIFDLIWADPPYDLVPQVSEELLALSCALLGPGGTIILESSADWQAKEVGPGWRLVRDRVYGATRISFFEGAL